LRLGGGEDDSGQGSICAWFAMASSASRAVRLWAHVIRPLPRALDAPGIRYADASPAIPEFESYRRHSGAAWRQPGMTTRWM
jgi:hypothetical protein